MNVEAIIEKINSDIKDKVQEVSLSGAVCASMSRSSREQLTAVLRI